MARGKLGTVLLLICAITADWNGCHAKEDVVPESVDGAKDGAVHAFREGAETLKFQAEVNRMMDILINSLYSNKDIFLRELISNAADALDKIRFLSLTNKTELATGEDLSIKIWVDEERKILSLRDTGVGMTRAELVANLGTVARSGTSAFLESVQKGGDLSLIGQFGVGFYSVYLVADYVEVVTKHNNDSQWVWESRASGDYALSRDEGPGAVPLVRGTQINIHLKPACEEYAQPDKLRELVQRYSEFISFPISLREERTVTRQVPLEEGEGAGAGDAADDVVDEDEEAAAKPATRDVTETVTEWNVLNDAQALWLRTPGEVSEEDYTKFYQTLSKNSHEKPLAHSHFRAEGDVEFRAVLYVPAAPPPDLYQDYYNRKSTLKLYVRRVFISDSFDNLLPKWLSFLVGLVDSDSMPLNVSREMLQLHEGLKVIKKKLVRKALDMLRQLSEKERSAVKELEELGPAPVLAVGEELDEAGKAAAERRAELAADKSTYVGLWKGFHKAIKMGVIEEKAHRKRMLPLLRFKSSASGGNDTSLDDYVARMKENQTHIYYHIGMSEAKVENSPFVETLVARGYEVVYLSDPLDEYMMNSLSAYDGHDFVNVSKDDLKLPEDEDAKEKEKKVKAEFKPLTKWWKKLLVKGQPIESVRISQRLSSGPCLVMANKFGWSAQMERLSMTQALGGDPDAAKWQRGLRSLEINPAHPLIKELQAQVAAAPDAAATKNRAMVLYETCLMESGYLVEDVSAFNARVRHLLGSSLGLKDLVEPQPPASKLDEVEPEGDGEQDGEAFASALDSEESPLGDLDPDLEDAEAPAAADSTAEVRDEL